MKFSERSGQVEPFLAMEVLERSMEMQRGGASIIQLGIGEPDFAPPPGVIDATVAALQGGDTHYTDSRGVWALREGIAQECAARRGVEVSPDRVLVTTGTSSALVLVFSLLLDPGDEVVIPTPHYPGYPNIVRVCGGTPVFVETAAEDGYRIEVDLVRRAITPRTRAIVMASPANPTGAIQSQETVAKLASLGIPIISDEVYDGLVYDAARVTSPLEFSNGCFILDGFSKRYAMTGFRLGYVIGPEASMRRLQSMQQNLFISASQFVQSAGLAALASGAYVEGMRTEYAARRKLMLAGVRELGLNVPVDPAGAFYVFADARHLRRESLPLAFELLEKARVTLGPGRDFGVAGEGFLRFSFCASQDSIRNALARLGPVLSELS